MARQDNSLDAELPFPLKEVQTTQGILKIYDIPEDQKQVVLEKLYLFRPIPKLDKWMEDIHAEKLFQVREFIVAREGSMNVLASPYYPESGGTVIDWVPARRPKKSK
jgi:hypothetical protein